MKLKQIIVRGNAHARCTQNSRARAARKLVRRNARQHEYLSPYVARQYRHAPSADRAPSKKIFVQHGSSFCWNRLKKLVVTRGYLTCEGIPLVCDNKDLRGGEYQNRRLPTSTVIMLQFEKWCGERWERVTVTPTTYTYTALLRKPPSLIHFFTHFVA